jgi:hypothetical protein
MSWPTGSRCSIRELKCLIPGEGVRLDDVFFALTGHTKEEEISSL